MKKVMRIVGAMGVATSLVDINAADPAEADKIHDGIEKDALCVRPESIVTDLSDHD